MRLPYLASWDKTPITVTITSDRIGENGAAEVLATYDGRCNFVSKTKTVANKDGRTVSLSGSLTIKGDIAPGVDLLAGQVTVNGAERNIFNGQKVLNPDGSVNHTYLELL